MMSDVTSDGRVVSVHLDKKSLTLVGVFVWLGDATAIQYLDVGAYGYVGVCLLGVD